MLARVHPRYGTPAAAIALPTLFTLAGACLGDALLIPISEVGSLAAGVGWCAACLARVGRARRTGGKDSAVGLPVLGAAVSAVIVLMKVVPAVPGSFTGPEWIALAAWMGLGLGLSGGRWRTVKDGEGR